MKVSLKWLAEYVDVPADVKEFCDRLDLTGTGVEGVEKTGAALDGVMAIGLAEADGDVLHAPMTAADLALTDPATGTP